MAGIECPCVLYHLDRAPQGELFNDPAAAQAAVDAGYVDTPAKFDPNYQPPAPVMPLSGDEVAPSGRPVQQYPKILYNRAGQDVLVSTVDDEAALDPEEWRDSPAAFRDDPPPAAAPADRSGPAPVGPSPVAPIDPPVAPAAAPVAPNADAPSDLTADASLTEEQETARAAAFAEKAAALHAMTAIDAIAKIQACTDLEILRDLQNMESINPKDPRVSVVRALKNRIAELTAK